MKSRYILLGVLAMTAVTKSMADEHTMLDPVSQALLRGSAMQINRPDTRISKSPSKTNDLQIALVRLNKGTTAADLVADGFDAVDLRGGFAAVTCRLSEVNRLVAHKAVRQCEFNRKRKPKLDLARAAVGVDAISNGIDLPKGYTGKGVVTGIVDGGFDPNHINFKDSEGNTRFKYFSTVEASNTGSGIRVTPYTPAQLANYTTDDNTQTHGTHTLGIMAGSYKGEAIVGSYDHSTGKPSVALGANPYYGIATESTIYASSGASYDALIAYAIDGMLEYRWYNDHGKPVVINLSLGGNNGPHDGSGMLCQYLDAVAKEDGAVFCISSGNEGDVPIALHKTFTDEDTELATFIRPYVYNDMRYGLVEIYSDSDLDFDISIIIYNKARGRIARTFPLNNKSGQIQYICSDESYRQDESDIVDATFAKAYEGYAGVVGLLDEESGRFKAVVDYYAVNSDANPAEANTEAQYTLGFVIKAHPGQRVDCFCDGDFTVLDSYGYDGYSNGSRNGTISDIATAHSAIAVGSYNTREWASNLDGNLLGYDGYFRLNEVTDFSSYGTLVDGRNLPHVLAPGCTVVSSVSAPYFNNPSNGASEQTVTAKYYDSTRNHYFQPMMGTSMSAPVVSGVVALMLEANPELDSEAVREILMNTAVVESSFASVEDPVQYGAGRINAHEAMKEAIRRSGMIAISAGDTDKAMFSSTGNGRWNVLVPGAASIHASVYAVDGHLVYSANAAGDEMDIDLTHLHPGIYIITVNDTYTEKLVVSY